MASRPLPSDCRKVELVNSLTCWLHCLWFTLLVFGAWLPVGHAQLASESESAVAASLLEQTAWSVTLPITVTSIEQNSCYSIV